MTWESDGASRRDGNDIVLTLRVTPGASTDSIAREDGAIRVRLQTPPVEGKANKSLIKMLGKAFKVPRSDVVLERGAGSRIKRVRIVNPARLPDFVGHCED